MTTRGAVEGVQKEPRGYNCETCALGRNEAAGRHEPLHVGRVGVSAVARLQGDAACLEQQLYPDPISHIPCSHGPIPLPKGAVFDELEATVPPGLKCDPGSCRFRVGSHQLLLAGTNRPYLYVR